MNSRLIWLAAFTCCQVAVASVGAAQESVPVNREPRHHYVVANTDVRIFDVVVPVGDTTLFHLHSNDYTYITFGGADLVAEVLGSAATPLALHDGEVRFSRAPLTHRVSNPGSRPFHNLTIELLSRGVNAEMPALEPGDSVVMDNDRVRVVRREIQAGATTLIDHAHGHAFDVFVNGGVVEEDEYGGSEPVKPATFRWRDGGAQRLYNVGDGPIVVLTVYVK